MKLVTLIENTTCRDDLRCEHGLSLYIETGSHKILFDMGQTGAFADNAETLGVALSGVDFAVLSHGHYDHGGGMAQFRQVNDHAPVYVSRHAFEAHFNAAGRYIGLDRSLPRDRLRFVEGTLAPGPGITLCSVPFPPEDTAGMTMEDGQAEDFRHEQYLLVEEGGKRILFTGCSHKGVVRLAKHFRPDILIGGFHFMKTEEESVLEAAARELLALPCRYYTGHCTGLKQFTLLKKHLGSRLHYLPTGSITVLP